jgi:hypothetical protein
MTVHGFDLLYAYKEKGSYCILGKKLKRELSFSSRPSFLAKYGGSFPPDDRLHKSSKADSQ